jgi:hypothetical protein
VNQCSLVDRYWCFKITYWPYHSRYFQKMTATFILTAVRTSRLTPLGHLAKKLFSVIHTFPIKWLSGPISSYTCWYVSYCGLSSRLSVNRNIRCFHNINKFKLLLLFKSYLWYWYLDKYFLHIISTSILTVKSMCWNLKNTCNQRKIQSTAIVVVFCIIHFA